MCQYLKWELTSIQRRLSSDQRHLGGDGGRSVKHLPLGDDPAERNQPDGERDVPVFGVGIDVDPAMFIFGPMSSGGRDGGWVSGRSSIL